MCSDPQQWSTVQVCHWLVWAIENFNLEGIDSSKFCCTGYELIDQGREKFLQRAPPYVGDILWEHLEILQKGIFWNHIYSFLCGSIHWKTLRYVRK